VIVSGLDVSEADGETYGLVLPKRGEDNELDAEEFPKGPH